VISGKANMSYKVILSNKIVVQDSDSDLEAWIVGDFKVLIPFRCQGSSDVLGCYGMSVMFDFDISCKDSGEGSQPAWCVRSQKALLNTYSTIIL